MTYDNFTIKAQESILAGQRLAATLNQQHVDTTHLVRGIMDTDDNVSTFFVAKNECQHSFAKAKAERCHKNYPRVEGTEKQ